MQKNRTNKVLAGTRKTWGTCNGNAQPLVMFLLDSLSNGVSLFQDEIWLWQKHRLIVTVFTAIYWMKSARMAEPILSISTILMGALRETSAEPAVSNIKLNIRSV